MSSATVSPYVVSMSELVRRFATGAARRCILDGLLRYRGELRTLGFIEGFQWLDGSFVEDVESRESRAPNDIDVVTFARPPLHTTTRVQVQQLLDARPALFDRDSCKQGFHCDTTLVNLSTSPEWLVKQTRYWYGLYSHRRGDAVWKGMLEAPLVSDDALARDLLDAMSVERDSDAA